MRLNRNENFSNATNKKGSKNQNQKSSRAQLKFAPELITSIREYCNQEPPNFIAFSNLSTPLYQAKNFTLNEKNGQIVRQKQDGNKNQDLKILLKTSNVLLESLKIEKYHLNGTIICSKLSSDQSCYIRVSYDNWTTFQETQAVLVQENSKIIGNGIRRFCFDFILPVPKNENLNLMNHFGQNNKNNRLNVKRGSIDSTESGISVGSCSTVTSQDSSSSASGLKKNSNNNNNIFQKHLIEQFGFSSCTGFYQNLPQHFEICVVMRNKSMLFYDFNDGGGGYGIELVEQGGDSYQIC